MIAEKEMRRVRRVGLTGGIATGKSHVREAFERRGVPAIDADVLARQAVVPGSPGLAAVVERFGAGMLTPAGGLDRAALGALVFSDEAARRDLEAIIHPEVRRATDAWFDALDSRAHPFAVAEIPLLFETGRDRDFADVIVVACSPDEQVRRITTRDGIPEPQARQRIAAQMPIGEKVRRATYVIRTDRTFEDTEAQVQRVYLRLAAAARPTP